MQTREVRKQLTSGVAAVAGLAIISGALAQECDVQQILSAGDKDNANDVTSIDHAAMNSSGTVVISVAEVIDPFEDDIDTRILQWSISDPDTDPTENPLLDTGSRGADYVSVSRATINDNSPADIIFVGSTGKNGINVFDLASETPQLSFPKLSPLSIGNLVLLDDDTDLTFLYWQLSFDGSVTEHCVKRNNDPNIEFCGDNVRVYISPDGNNAGDVYFLKIDVGIDRQIRNSDDMPICTVQSNAVLTGPSVNEAGNVAFYASESCDGSGDPDGEGIYLYDAGTDTLELVVSFANPALGLSVPPLVQRPHLNDEGRTAFVAREGSNGDFGIYIYSPINSGRVIKIQDGAHPDYARVIFGYMADPDDPNGETDRVLYRGMNVQGQETLFMASGCPFEILPPADCLGDINGDNEVNGLDMLALLGEWGACPGCDSDLNGDGNVDGLDLLILLSNWGPCPDVSLDCGEIGSGDCCEANGTPSCDDGDCCEAVCAQDSFCCDIAWDGFCAFAAGEVCFACGAEPGCGVVGVGNCCEEHDTPYCDDAGCCEVVCGDDPFCCENQWDEFCADAAENLCVHCGAEPGCGAVGAGNCCEAHDTPYCDDDDCCEQICANDPFCCDTEWDDICAGDANEQCAICLACGDEGAGNCCVANGTSYCDDEQCCELVCDGDPFCCDTEWDNLCADDANDLCDICSCGGKGSGNCCEANGTPYCDDEQCCELVCDGDPFCCDTEWDNLCADDANDECTVCQPETNDTCEESVLIECGTKTLGSTLDATVNDAGFCGTSHTAPEVWYKVIGTGDEIEVTTCNEESNYDTKLSVWTGSCGALECVGGNDDASCEFGGLLSRVTFDSVDGQTYYIMVHGFAGATGDFGLNVICETDPR